MLNVDINRSEYTLLWRMNARYQAAASARITAAFAAMICTVNHGSLCNRSNTDACHLLIAIEREFVPETSNGLDHGARILPQLGAQMVHMYVNCLGADRVFVSINGCDQRAAFAYSIRTTKKVFQYPVFMRGQLDGGSIHEAGRLSFIQPDQTRNDMVAVDWSLR